MNGEVWSLEFFFFARGHRNRLSPSHDACTTPQNAYRIRPQTRSNYQQVQGLARPSTAWRGRMHAESWVSEAAGLKLFFCSSRPRGRAGASLSPLLGNSLPHQRLSTMTGRKIESVRARHPFSIAQRDCWRRARERETACRPRPTTRRERESRRKRKTDPAVYTERHAHARAHAQPSRTRRGEGGIERGAPGDTTARGRARLSLSRLDAPRDAPAARPHALPRASLSL